MEPLEATVERSTPFQKPLFSASSPIGRDKGLKIPKGVGSTPTGDTRLGKLPVIRL